MAETTTSTTTTSTSTTSTSTTTTSTTSTTSTSTTLSAITIEHIRSRVKFITQDDAELLRPEEQDLAIENAVAIYSKDRPYKRIHEDATPNSVKYDFDLPSDWVEDFSYITGQIEYPVSSALQTPEYVLDDEWIIYRTLSGSKLRFISSILASSYSMRYEYVIPHVISDSNCTVYHNDLDAVCNLASSFVFKALAAKYAQTSEPTIDADVIDYATKSDYYARLADNKYELYQKHLGSGDKAEEKPGAATQKDLDMDFAWGGSYLTHPRNYR